MADRSYRDWTCKLWKNGAEVGAHYRGPNHFKPTQTYALMPRERVFAVDTESLTKNGKLTTLLTPVHFHDGGITIETPEGKGMLERLFDALFRRGFAVKENAPSDTAQRPKRKRQSYRTKPVEKRDGDRQSIEPVLSVWFNMPYDFGRLAADSPYMLRAVAAGAPSYRLKISDRFELEVRRMILGNAPSFDWRIRDVKAKSIVRMLGIDLVGYWKTSLAKAAKAVGVTEKVDIEATIDNVYERTFESFTAEEWHLFKLYGLGDVQSTLELYHRTSELLTQIDPRVVRSSGVIPPSAPGASAKIVFAKAFDCHPEIDSWERYPTWADQMGARAYFGGRAFCTRPGIFRRMHCLDLKSAYPLQMALLPDPVTLRTERVRDQAFDLTRFRGRYGVVCISGEGLDDVMPAFRAHDEERGGRLRYVTGKFERAWVTIPEVVIGVVRGALRVDRVHDGVVMYGDPEKSFLRAGVKDFFAIKENKENEKALRDLAKLLANSLYGKLIEVITSDYLIVEREVCPRFKEKEGVCVSIAALFASAGAPENFDSLYWGPKPEIAQTFFRTAFDPKTPIARRGSEAITAYLEALSFTDAPSEPGPCVFVAEYVRDFKHYKCGQYFMPLYAAQVTGATSAMVGLMAACLDAYQGDTDSVHVQLPDGIDRIEDMPGYARYFDLMQEAGYPSPRKVGDVYVGGVPGISNLGAWEQETPEASSESILVRPKVYSHRFADGSHKQAKHGFARFHSPKIDAVLKDASKPREEREKTASRLRQSELHDAMKQLLCTGAFKYDARKSPRKLREAIRSGKPVGEFTSRLMAMTLTEDPNTYRDRFDRVHWRARGP